GWQFESVLKRGLLEFALRLPDDAPEFRYCYHEVIEEAQHSLFFREFVRHVRSAAHRGSGQRGPVDGDLLATRHDRRSGWLRAQGRSGAARLPRARYRPVELLHGVEYAVAWANDLARGR